MYTMGRYCTISRLMAVQFVSILTMASVGFVAPQLSLMSAGQHPQLSAPQYAPQLQYATKYAPQAQSYSGVPSPTLLQQQPITVFPQQQLQQKPQQTVDSMQQNLKVLLNYLDEPALMAPVQPQTARLFAPSANPVQQPLANVLVTMTPSSGWNPQPLGGVFTPQPAQYSQKVRRMAVPQPINFMQSDAGLNTNYLNSVLLRPQNDVELPDGGGDEDGTPDEDSNDSTDGPVDEDGAPLKFSKLGKPADVSAIVGNPLKVDEKNTAKPLPPPSAPQTRTTPKAPSPPSITLPPSGSPPGANGSQPEKIASGMAGLGGLGGSDLSAGIISPQNKNEKVIFGNGNEMDTNNSPWLPSILPQSGQLPMIIPQQQRTGDSFAERVTPPKYNFKLIYFDARGICEPIRLLFHYAKVPFEDARITRRQWLALKDNTIYGKVPILEVDGKPLTYCHTISRFLARTFGLAGTNNWEQAKVDEISDFHSDVTMDLQPYLYVVAGFHQGDREVLRKAIFLPGVEKHFQVYVNLLKQSGSGFFVQSGLTWIDFVISEYMTTIKHFEPAILDKYPALMKFIRKVQSLPEIFDYVANREHQPV